MCVCVCVWVCKRESAQVVFVSLVSESEVVVEVLVSVCEVELLWGTFVMTVKT